MSGTNAPNEGQKAEDIRIPSEELEELRLRFTLAKAEPPSRLNATLTVEGYESESRTPSALVELPVRGAAKAMSGSFEPKTAVVLVSRGCPFLCASGSREVTLVGREVSEALRDLKDAGTLAPYVDAHRGDGSGHRLTLEDLKLSEDGDAATAELMSAEDPGPGKYTATLPLSRYAETAPTLAVELRSRVWWPWAFLTILLGTLVGGWLLHAYGLDRRRQRIRQALADKVDQYCPPPDGEGRREVPSKDSGGPIWNLNELIDDCALAPDPNWTYYSEIKTSRQMFAALPWARSDADLDEIQEAVVGLLKRVDTWLAIREPVAKLQEQHQAEREERPSKLWEQTNTAADTRLLLEAVKREPLSPDDVRALRDRLTRQSAWYEAYAATWDLLAELEADGVKPLPSAEFDKLDEKAPRAAQRTFEQQDDLIDQLRRLFVALTILNRARTSPGDEPAKLPYPDPRDFAGEEFMHELYAMHGTDERARQSPFGRVTLSAPKMTIATRASTLRKWLVVDWLLSLVIVAVTALVYTLTVYDDDWGSLSDFAAAFGAGIAGQVAVKWALLPAYRSLRLRTSASGAPSAAA